MAVTTGTFTAAAQVSEAFALSGKALEKYTNQFNIWLADGGSFAGSVILERSFDNGATYYPISANAAKLLTWTFTGTSGNFSEFMQEVESGIVYRLRCITRTAGTLTYRMSCA